MTTWISHRGFCGKPNEAQNTENTAEAFHAAIEFGFDHLETDLRTTKDGHIVLCHDPDLNRVSGSTRAIHEMSRKELANERLLHGERFLFFDQFLEHFSHLNWILDIKPEQASRTIELLSIWSRDPAVAEFLANRARYLFWDARHEQHLTSELPDATCLARDRACYRAGVASLFGVPTLGNIQAGQAYAVPPRIAGVPILNENLVKRFHQQNAKVIGYLPVTDADHKKALQANVDQLLTNHAHLKADSFLLLGDD